MYQIRHASYTLFTLGTIFVDNENQRTITVSLDLIGQKDLTNLYKTLHNLSLGNNEMVCQVSWPYVIYNRNWGHFSIDIWMFIFDV